jgi:hypothetical protein
MAAGRRVRIRREQFRDSEVEQLRHAVVRHENVVHLDDAVDDEMLVRVLDRGAHLLEQWTFRQRQPLSAQKDRSPRPQ